MTEMLSVYHFHINKALTILQTVFFCYFHLTHHPTNLEREANYSISIETISCMHFAFPVRKNFKFLLLKNYCSFHINETNSFTDTSDTWNKTFLFNLKKEAHEINLLVAINNFYYIYF